MTQSYGNCHSKKHMCRKKKGGVLVYILHSAYLVETDFQ